MRPFEPLQRLRQLSDSRVKLLLLGQAVSLHGLDHRSVKRNRGEGERLLAAAQARLRVSSLDVRRTRPPPADHFESEIIHRLTVLEGPTAVLEALVPFTQAVGHAHEDRKSTRLNSSH